VAIIKKNNKKNNNKSRKIHCFKTFLAQKQKQNLKQKFHKKIYSKKVYLRPPQNKI